MTRQQALCWGLFATVITVPLIFGTRLHYPFVVYRTYVFYVLVDVLFTLFLLTYGAKGMVAAWRHPVLRWGGLFLLAKLLTDLLGEHVWVSLLGNYERMMGFLTHLHLFVFLVIAVVACRESSVYRRLLDAVVISGGLVSLYGIAQHFDIAFRIHRVDDRLFSTVGNPAFLGGFLLFSVFFGFLRSYEEKKSWRRALFIAATAFSLWALYLTATRGALLGLLAGLAVGSMALRHRVNAKTLAVTVVLLAVAVFALHGTLAARRLASISLSDFSVRSRIQVWNMAWQGIRERPITGYGEQMVSDPLDRYMSPDVLETWFDSSHNVFLDILLSHGIIGFVFFLLFFGAIIREAYRNRGNTFVFAVCSAALAAYGVQGLFIFDTLVVLLPLFVLIGFIAVSPAASLPLAPVHGTTKDRIAAGIGIIVAAMLLLSYIRPIRALAAASEGRFSDALHLATFGYGNIATMIRDASFLAFKRPFDPATAQSFLSLAEDAYAKARKGEGERSIYYGDLAQIYLTTPRELRMASAVRAEELLDRAIEISPGRVDLYYAKAQALYDSGDRQASAALLRSMLIQFPAHAERTRGVLKEVEARIDG